MPIKKSKIIVISLAALVIFGAFALNDRFFDIARSMSIYSSLYKEVNNFYVDPVNPNKLMNEGIDAMLRSLDPYTNYIPEDRIEDFRTLNTGQYGGIGASTIRLEGSTYISMIFEGYPAQQSDLQIGDEVIMINKVPIDGKTRDEIRQLMKGQSETDVILTVRRYGQPEPMDITVGRTQVTINNVPYFGMIDENKGYIKLTEFTRNASRNIKDAVIKLKDQGAKSIVLDLRDNPGGLLVEAVNISNIFLPKGVPVVSTKGKISENNTDYRAMFKSTDIRIPLVVLINSGSASASEIVAGVIQDYDRGVILGKKSYGKGLVQTTRRLSYNAQLKVTTAKYYIPSGRCIQALDYSNKGVDGSVGKVPDSLISEFRTSNGRTVYDGGGIDPDVEVEVTNIPSVATNLINQGFLFNYANKFYYEHDSIAGPELFRLSDNEYDQFINWLGKQDFKYQKQAESDMEKIFISATEENRWEDIKEAYENLSVQISNQKKQDLETFRPIIKNLLEEELVSRYYLQRGAIEAGFKEDPYLSNAKALLDDPEKYERLLGN